MSFFGVLHSKMSNYIPFQNKIKVVMLESLGNIPSDNNWKIFHVFKERWHLLVFMPNSFSKLFKNITYSLFRMVAILTEVINEFTRNCPTILLLSNNKLIIINYS